MYLIKSRAEQTGIHKCGKLIIVTNPLKHFKEALLSKLKNFREESRAVGNS